MVTAAEIQSIDFTSNSCVVRIPFFETVNTIDPFTLEAKICIPPGIYNGYQVGDTVWVDFIDDIKGQPLVIGKIYQGVKEENTKASGAVHSSELITSNSAKLPKNTTFENVDAEYNSISKIINKIKTATKSDGQPDVTPTTEEFTNELWIDKKPIYKKVLYKDIDTGTGAFTITFDISNIAYDTIWVDYSCSFLSGANRTVDCSHYVNSSNRCATYIDHTNKQIVVTGYPAGGVYTKIVITVKYTKK